MTTITTRAGKGSPLTNTELDNNFTNLNTAKYESGDNVSLGTATFSGDVSLVEATPFLRLQESGSGGAKRLDLSVNASAEAKIEANQSASTMIFNVSSAEAVRFKHNADGVIFNDGGADRDFRVESDTSSHALFVDGGNNAVHINSSGPTNLANGLLTVYGTTAGNQSSVFLVGNFSNAQQNSSSARLTFSGNAQAAGYTIQAVNVEAYGKKDLVFYGNDFNDYTTEEEVIRFSARGGAVFNQQGKDADFRVESYSNSNMFVVDSGSNWVRINEGGGQSTGDKFLVEGSASINGFRVIRGQSWGSWSANTDYYLCTMNPGYNGTSAAANIDILAGGVNVSVSYRVVAINASGTTNVYAYCTGTNTGSFYLIGYRDNSNAAAVHFYVRPTSSVSYTPRTTVTGHGSLVYDPNAPSAPVDDDYSWYSGSMYARRVLSGTGMDVTSAYDTVIDLTDARTTSPASTKFKSVIGWSHYHGRSLTFGVEHNDYSMSNRRALLKFNSSTNDVEGYERLTITGGETVFNEESQNLDFRVESDSNSHALFVDASANTVAVGGTGGWGTLQVIGATNSEYRTFFVTESTDASKGVGIAYDPTNDRGVIAAVDGGTTWKNLALSPSGGYVSIGLPTTSSIIAPLHIEGGSTMTGGWVRTLHLEAMFPVMTFQSTYNTDTYAGIGYDTSNDNMDFWVGATTSDVSADGKRVLRLKNYEAAFNDYSIDLDFRVESDDHANALFVEGSTGRVGIKQANPAAELDVQGDMVLEGYMRRSTGAKQSSPSFADGDWISLATIQYGEVLGVVGVEWNSLTTTGSAHHGYTRLKIGSYYNSYYYGWETTLQMLDTQHHNGFHFSEFRIIRPDGYTGGDQLVLQGKTSSVVVAGSFQVYVESRLGPNADNITPLQPVVDNSPTGNTIQAQISTPVGTLNAISGGLSVTGATVLNEFGANQDFRVESDSKSHALFVDAGANLVMVGRDSTTETTGVYGAVINATGSTSNIRTYGDGSNHSHLQFIHNGSGAVGSITTLSTGTTYNTTSDRRLKDNIEPIADGTAKLLAMNPVTHTWKNVPDAPAVHGFIAQEMIDIVPEAVSGDPTGQEMMSMDYGRITPVLVAALQDAHKKIAELEARLNILEGK